MFWQNVSLRVDRPIMPSPLVAVALLCQSIFGELGLHLLASSGLVLAAILLVMLTAAPLGLLLGQMPRLDRVIGPLIAIMYPIQKIIFLPVIYVLMGISDFSKVTLIAIIIFSRSW